MTIMPSRAGEGRHASEPAARPIPDRAVVAVLAGMWLCSLLVVGHGDEVPANDSWAYVRATESFLQTGHIVRVPWTYAPVVTNVLLGALFAKIFGLSFFVLRMSSFLMGGLGMIALYGLARVHGCSRGLSALIAGTFAFGMMHLGLSYTFMTDVPYTALAIASLLAFTLGLQRKSLFAHGVGIVATVAATLSRQTGVVIAAGLLVTLALARIRTRRDLWLAVTSLAGLCMLAFVVERVLMGWSNFGVFRALTSAFLGKAPVYTLASHSFASQTCLGLTALPFLVPLLLRPSAIERKKLVVGAVLGAFSLFFSIWKFSHLPFWSNLIDPGGLGPIAVHCATVRPMLPSALWWALVTVSSFAGGVCVALIGFWVWEVAWPERSVRPERLFLFVSAVLYLAPVLLRNPYFNRYLIPIVPAWLLMVSAAVGNPVLPRRSQRLGFACVLGLALFSSATARDYLAHLGLRSSLVAPLLERGVNAGLIEGGMEFDGQHRYMRPGVVNYPTTPHDNVWLNERGQELLKSGPSWPHPETYLVSYCPVVPGYRVTDSAERARFVPPTKEKLYLLERTQAR
jgi:hypothetical protein